MPDGLDGGESRHFPVRRVSEAAREAVVRASVFHNPPRFSVPTGGGVPTTVTFMSMRTSAFCRREISSPAGGNNPNRKNRDTHKVDIYTYVVHTFQVFCSFSLKLPAGRVSAPVAA